MVGIKKRALIFGFKSHGYRPDHIIASVSLSNVILYFSDKPESINPASFIRSCVWITLGNFDSGIQSSLNGEPYCL
ncbi:hypothetical protein DN30_4027 [Vibrio cholerae]|nr:hypothetical protein DN30_4027 [Vibrio cholerae]